MRGRGKGGEPIEWTGWAPSAKCEIEANPDLNCMSVGTSLRKQAEVIEPHAVKKSL